jgi:hypothetical protein
MKIEFAKHNAAIYGVAECIEFIVGDFFQLAPLLKVQLFPSILYCIYQRFCIASSFLVEHTLF